MIYLISKQRELFKSDKYEVLPPKEALEMLRAEPKLGGDTETEGLSPYTKKLLSVQLGIEDYQIVWDCASYPVSMLKPILECPEILTIWWNYKFDGQFLYHNKIIPVKVYDGMLAEKLMWLGYPAGMHSMSLQSAGMKYCNVLLDKSVRGKIATVGLTPEVIVYSAFDVKYEIPIYEAQLKELEKRDLVKAAEFESEFVKVLAYIEYCGVKLDVDRWKKKMKNDSITAEVYKKALDDWMIASTTGKQSSVTYISLLGKSEKNLNKERKDLNYIKRRKELDLSYPSGANFEAYEVSTSYVPGNYTVVDLQGDLFSGFNTDPKCTINWDSAKQIIPIFEHLGFKLDTFDKETKKKKKSVESKIIKPQKDLSPLAEIYLNYKAAQKVTTTYGQNFLDAINKGSGRIHASFNQLMDTGRLSCGGGESKVNVQNLPADPETRACFIAEKGNKWISADYQSQESRLIASIANDPAMIELFEHGCGDVHSLVAKMAYSHIIGDTPVEEISAKFHDLRQDAKGIEFAINLLLTLS